MATRERANELQQKHDTLLKVIKENKNRFSRAKNLSSMERLSITMRICEYEEQLILINRELRLLWIVSQAQTTMSNLSSTDTTTTTTTD